MCVTYVITTTEEANAVLAHLDRLAVAGRENNYALERAKPVRWMYCCCCGAMYYGRQWWNQDCRHGLGDCCVERCGVDPNGGENELYGVPGIHFLIPEDRR